MQKRQFLKLNINFDIAIDSHAVVKNKTDNNTHVLSSQLSPE